MEGEEGPADAAIVAVAVATADSTPPSPPNDSDVSPVGSPDHGASSEILRLPSDDDPDQSAGGALTEDLKQKIIKQARSLLSLDLVIALSSLLCC